jgi:heme-degrading monooxygenase HmoA
VLPWPNYEENLVSDLEVLRVIAVISRFTIANNMVAQVREAFQNRPHLVDQAPGFLRMEVMSPFDKPEEVWLVTHWEDEQSFQVWHESHAYHESHKGIPKGLKLVPKTTEIRRFEMFAT